MSPIDDRPSLVFLMGATASGKTRIACECRERFNLGLISVDSALVYRGMDVGTAKPDAALLARHPHRLIDIREPEEAYSAANFRADAEVAIAEALAAGRVPMLVGGTGLYFRALERGLSSLPSADPAVRKRLAEEAETHGKSFLHARLARLDPATAARLNPQDSQRVQRALEVIELSGARLSALQGARRPRPPWRILKLALVPEHREVLHARIAERFDAMLAAGLAEELRRLRARPGWSADLPAMRAVGYRQGWAWLDGEIDLARFRQTAIEATRQLAKRQITWLRSELDARMIDSDNVCAGTRVADAIARFLPG